MHRQNHIKFLRFDVFLTVHHSVDLFNYQLNVQLIYSIIIYITL